MCECAWGSYRFVWGVGIQKLAFASLYHDFPFVVAIWHNEVLIISQIQIGMDFTMKKKSHNVEKLV